MNKELTGTSLDVAEENRNKLKQLFPSVFTETKNEKGELVESLDYEKLKAELGNFTDLFESRRERYGMEWPGKKEALKLVQQTSNATLKPAPDESINFDTTENVFIEGDNLEVLKLLQKSYYGKIKMIYIDPPYNTGSDFVYPDNFSDNLQNYLEYTGQVDSDGKRFSTNTANEGRFHTKWLNMMFPRLYLARNLLRDDGVIFISIDDNEVTNLKKICDEIFGEENFVGILSVENNPKGRKNSAFVSVSSEYCVIYAKSKKDAHFIENIPKKASDMTLDENGNFVHGSGKRVLVGENSFNDVVQKVESDKNYSVYYHEADYDLIIKKEIFGQVDQQLIKEGYVKYFSHNDNQLIENTYSEDSFRELFEQRALEFSTDKIYEKNFSDTIRIKSQLVNRKYEAIVKGKKQDYSMELTTTGAGTYLKNLFEVDDSPFSSPKNIGFIKVLLSLFRRDDFIVLDFFSGSSTTADAVMSLNVEDGGNRKFIMVQIPESLEANLQKAGTQPEKKVIKSAMSICKSSKKPCLLTEISKERIRRAIKKLNADDEGKLDLAESKQDRGFKVFKLDKTNFKQWEKLDPKATEEQLVQQLTLNIDNVSDLAQPLDLLYELILKAGFQLSEPVETVALAGKTVYAVGGGALLLCLEDTVTKELIDAVVECNPQQFICLDRAFHNNDQLKANAVQTFKDHNRAQEKFNPVTGKNETEKFNQIVFKTV